eukprot:g593.t1
MSVRSVKTTQSITNKGNAVRRFRPSRLRKPIPPPNAEPPLIESPPKLPKPESREGPSTDPKVIFSRLKKLALPFWTDPEVGTKARLKLGGVVLLTVATTGVSVGFNFLGRDFFNALSDKNVTLFTNQLFKYLGAFTIGIPVFVFKDYFQVGHFYNAMADRDVDLLHVQLLRFLMGTLFGTPIYVSRRYFKSTLSLEWRDWMSKKFLTDYLENRTFYRVQSTAAFDNPDQRISVDVQLFTSTALAFVLTLLNAGIDLVSFSEILFSIYPPLFIALIIYSVGGTWLSILIGKKLVGLNFRQEAREADFRFGLVRLRENAESIAFYNGEKKEQNLLTTRLQRAIKNYQDLLIASRNLDFFTSFYRYLIMLLPAAVVAPIFFKGEIGFGVVTQSQSAFSHILSDISLVVYQFEAIAGFSAVIDRLGEFQEVTETCQNAQDPSSTKSSELIQLETKDSPQNKTDPLLKIEDLTLLTPDSNSTLIEGLSVEVLPSQSLLVMGPSGAGKTSLLRAIAGLWSSGKGKITRYGAPISSTNKNGSIMFVPQRPYLVLGTLRDQLLYPTWAEVTNTSPPEQNQLENRPIPDDLELEKAMLNVNLGDVLRRCKEASSVENPLDVVTDWSSQLSIGEQQRLAFARILLSNPDLLLMDESTSALDVQNEQALYKLLLRSGISYVSVGHRPSLKQFHSQILNLSIAEDENSVAEWKLESLDAINSSMSE